MITLSSRRAAGIGGIVFIVGALLAILYVPSGFPAADDPPDEVLAFLADNKHGLIAQGIINILVVIPAIVFVPAFARLVSESEGEGSVSGYMVALAMAVAGALSLVGAAGLEAMGYLADYGLEASDARTLWFVFGILNQALFAPVAAVELIAGNAFARRNGALRYVGWLGLVAGVVSVLSIFFYAEDGFFQPAGVGMFAGFLGFSLFVLAVSAVLFREGSKPA